MSSRPFSPTSRPPSAGADLGPRLGGFAETTAASSILIIPDQLRLAKIELPFDVTSRFVRQLALAKKIVRPAPLGGDEQQLDLILELDVLLIIIVVASPNMHEPFAMTRAQWFYNAFRKTPFCRKLVESLERRLDRLAPRYVLIRCCVAPLPTTYVSEAERPDDRWQQQPLAYQR